MKTKEKSTREALYYSDTRPSVANFSRVEICKRNAPVGVVTAVYGDLKNFSVYIRSYRYTVLGPRMFWKCAHLDRCTYKDGKFFGTFTPEIGKLLCKVFHIDWLLNEWRNYAPLVGSRKDIWKAILSGKLTNPRDLCRYVSRKYSSGAYSVRTLKRYSSYPCISLWDIFYYTTNPELALSKYMDVANDGSEWASLMRDTLDYCKIYNTKLNPLWSLKRLAEEHQKQIAQEKAEELASIPNKPIVKDAPSIGGLHLIVDARSCFLEGESMHNCIYRCYWHKVCAGGYLLLQGTLNGEHINLGIRCSTWREQGNTLHSLEFDQAHTIYNGRVSKATGDMCLQLISDNRGTLINIVEEIIEGNPDSNVEEGIPPYDIPF